MRDSAKDEATLFARGLAAMIGLALVGLLCLVIFEPSRAAHAQTGNPQTWNQRVTWNGATSTNVAAQSDVLRNVDQSSHIVWVCPQGATALRARLEGSFDDVNWFPISGTAAAVGGCSTLSAGGYYPNVALDIGTLSGTGASVSAYYTATNVTLPSAVAVSPGDPCQDPLKAKSEYTVAASGDGWSQIGSASPNGGIVYVCGFTLTLTGSSATAQFGYAQTSCTSDEGPSTGTLTPLSGQPLASHGDWTQFVLNGPILCVNLGGTSPVLGGYVTFTTQ